MSLCGMNAMASSSKKPTTSFKNSAAPFSNRYRNHDDASAKDNEHHTTMNADNEWLSRNPQKRERRSYGSNWQAYEARSSRAGSNGFSSSSRVNFRAESILVEGERAGLPHAGGANANMDRQIAVGGRQRQPAASSGMRVADQRIPGGNSGTSSLSSALASSLHASLTNPPSISVSLPDDLRSTLNKEQCSVVESILSGHSVFFTGPAGSGKSHILKTLQAANALGLSNNGQMNIVLTATTGVAACSIGGTTLHSFAGITPNASDVECVKRVMGNEYAKKRWRECDVLVIDEVSMMSKGLLDKLNFVASRVRNDRRSFGGMQLVLCGDFFQLPPVELAKEGFAFEAKCWPQVIQHCVLLRQVFRQQSDTTLMTILDEARIGELSSKSAHLLKRHGTLPTVALGRDNDNSETKIIPTLLECRNKNVDQANEREMAKLQGEMHSFHARDRAVSESYRTQLKQCQAPAQLDLKIGAQVLLLKNIDLEKGLANGSRGVVVRFQPPKNGSEVPMGFKNMDLPVVRFDSVKSTTRGLDDEDREFTILPEEWQNKLGDQTVSARVQIPLRLAWSISVHKSQGMTIPNLTVNLAGVFEYGQAYVALSRATELKLLTLRGFSEKAFRAHPLVKEFYRILESPAAAIAIINAAHSKENFDAHHGGVLDELPDPFGGCSNPYEQQRPRVRSASLQNQQIRSSSQHRQHQRHPYSKNGLVSSSNPYSMGSSSNPYQTHYQYNAQQTNCMMPRPVQAPAAPSSKNISMSPPPKSISPTLTQDQKRRMEENRRRALAIRMKRKHGST